MKRLQKMMALVLAAVTVAGTGCGRADDAEKQSESTQEVSQEVAQESTQTTENEEPMEVQKITLYPDSAALESGVRGGYMGELMASYGVEVDVWAYSDDKTNAIMASGDLPDIMYVNAQNLELLIDSGSVLELTEYLDQIPSLSKVQGLDTALNYIKEFRSNGTGELYAMPTQVGPGSNDGTTERSALKIFWEYYEAIGMPEFSSMEDLIPILKEIQEKFPESENGNKVYAVGSYYGPTEMNFITGYGTIRGYRTNYFKYMGAANMPEGTCEYLLDENSILYEALSWYNKLYREGLLDPNSINMARTDQQTKMGDGTYILSMPDAPGWEPNYMATAFDDEKIYYRTFSSYGGNYYVVVNAETKNLEGCLRYLNFIADPDAYLSWRSLPEGEKWYVDHDNVIYPTEEALEGYKNGEPFVTSTGEAEKLWNVPAICHYGTPTSYVDGEGNYREPIFYCWPEILEINNATPQGLSWQEHYGCDTVVELFEREGILCRESKLDDATSFLEAPSDSQQLTISALTDIIVNDAWKMIYAESDADFQAIWDNMVSEAEELGAKDLYNWCCENIDNAIQIRDSLKN